MVSVGMRREPPTLLSILSAPDRSEAPTPGEVLWELFPIALPLVPITGTLPVVETTVEPELAAQDTTVVEAAALCSPNVRVAEAVERPLQTTML